jgi:MFS family permease
MFVFGLLAGGLSDRFPRPRLMAIGQSSNLIAAIAMVALLIGGNAHPWHAYIIIFVTGTTWALDYASRRALLGDIFSGRALTNATALDAGLVTGTNMIGPLLGTVLIRFFDFQGAYIGVMLLTITAFSLVISIKSQPRPQSATAGRGTPLAQIRDAVDLLRSNQIVLGAVLVTIAFNMMGWPFVQMVSVIARNQLGSGEIAFGFLLSGLGAGSLVGASFLAWTQPPSRGNVYTGGAALLMIAAIGFAWSPWYLLALFWMFVAGVGLAGFAAMQPVIPLEAVSADQRGRAMGTIVLGIGFQAVGMAFMGLIAEIVGPREAIAIMCTLGIASILMLRSCFPSLRDRPSP